MLRRVFVLLLISFTAALPFDGELYFYEVNGTNNHFDFTFTSNQYTWGLVNGAVQRVDFANINLPNTGSFVFNAPDNGVNTSDDYLPWGIYTCSLRVYRDAARTSFWDRVFTLDLRDLNWCLGYPESDLYVLIDLTREHIYLSEDVNPAEPIDILLDGKTIGIWQYWGMNPSQGSFNVPVVLKNKRENVNESFGYLVKNGANINSGSYADCLLNGQTISHGTTERTDAGVRSYSFRWNPIANTSITSSNIYNSSVTFTTLMEKNDKEIDREFRPVYPLTVKNLLPELGTQSYGTVMFKDPTTTNSPEEKLAEGSGFVKNEAFADLHITVNNVPEQKYSLQAKPSIIYNGRTYYWYQGDFNPTTQTDMLITTPTAKNAYYKGSMLTNNSAAFANNGQRAIAEYLEGPRQYLVYESLGHVWHEKGTSQGWEVLNGGRPLDNSEAKNPSIAHYITNLAVDEDAHLVVFQQKTSDGKYAIIVEKYKRDIRKFSYTVYTSANAYSHNANPVVCATMRHTGNPAFMVLWREPNALYCRIAEDNETTASFGAARIISGSGTGSVNFTADAAYDNSTLQAAQFHIAWEENKKIKYTSIGTYYNGITYQSAVEEPSIGNEQQYNFKPSITVTGSNSVKLAWMSSYFSEQSDDGGITFRSKTGTAWGAFWNHLDTFNPDFVSINKIGTSGEFAFVYGLAEYFNYICKNASQTNNLGTHEKYMQLANTPGVSITAVSHNAQAAPIPLNIKNISLSALQKESGEEKLNAYRGISMFKDSSVIRCSIGGIKLGQNDLEFEEIDYQDSLKDISSASRYLITKSFAVSGSSLSFQMKTGFNGSQADLIKENGFIKFKAELIEQSTGAVYALKEISLNGASSIDEGEMTYNIDLTALKDKTVRLRLTPENNGAAGFAVSNILTPERNPVAKENAVQLSLGESSIPTIYALSQNYPNPFNPSTVISYDIPEASRVTLKVYDILGREVADLVNEFKEAGRYNVKFDASHLSTGIYIYRLRANDYVSVKKMSFVK